MLYLQESPFLPKAATASPAKEPGAHVQISRSLFCFIPAAGGAAFCLIYSVLLRRCSEDRIIYVLLSFSRLLSAVASTRANSCLHSARLRAARRHQRPILQTWSGEALSSSQDFWLPSWRWQSPDFPKHFMLDSSFHVQITAPLCTREHPLVQARCPPLLCPGYTQGTLKAGHGHLDASRFPGQSKPMVQDQSPVPWTQEHASPRLQRGSPSSGMRPA